MRHEGLFNFVASESQTRGRKHRFNVGFCLPNITECVYSVCIAYPDGGRLAVGTFDNDNSFSAVAWVDFLSALSSEK